MKFVKTDDLRIGMRIGRPIYNKNGVLLYERDSKITSQSIVSIKNFGLIGIFVLEPAEPAPPMSEEDIEFERFQTVNVYALEDELKAILSTKKTHKIDTIVATIIKAYGHLGHKINFMQNLRSNEDFVYKHSLNVAILSTMMCHRMNLSVEETNETVLASLTHDIGKLTISPQMLASLSETEVESLMLSAQNTGIEMLESIFSSLPNVKRICAQTLRVLTEVKSEGEGIEKAKIVTGARVLMVAETFDSMTAMDATDPTKEPQSEVFALRYLIEHPDVFNKKAIGALVDSINILGPGTSVELSSGSKALVISTNYNNILEPMVLEFATNQIIDLSDRDNFGDLEIVDIMKSMDSRYVMDDPQMKALGINL